MTDPQACHAPHRRNPDRIRHVKRGTYLCGGHILGLGELLELLPKLHTALATVAAPSEVKIGGSRPAETPIPIRQDALDLRYGGKDPELDAAEQMGITESLIGWARILTEEHDLHLPSITDPQRLPYALAKLLTTHLDTIIEQRWVIDMLIELEDVRDRANRALGSHSRDDLTQIPCPRTECDGTMTAPYRDRELLHPDAGDVRLATLKCETCGHVELSADWHRITDRQIWLTDREAELWTDTQGFPVKAALIRSWANRDRLKRHRVAGKVVFSQKEIEALLPRVHGPVCETCSHSSCSRMRDTTREDEQVA